MITKQFLIDFETDIANRFLNKEINAPIHLSNGNEDNLIKIFSDFIQPQDWIFSTWRSHYHALLHGINSEWLLQEILDGHSMSICSNNPKFFTSAIVGGVCPIAVGVAMGIQKQQKKEKVFCFIGDMTWHTGIYHECLQYAKGHHLPIKFIIEDNGLSVGAPTYSIWGTSQPSWVANYYEDRSLYRALNSFEIYYQYQNAYPHVGCGQFVTF